MKKFIKITALPLLLMIVLFACKKEAKSPAVNQDEIAPEILAKIKDMGMNTEKVVKIDEGYLVEGDIIITHEDLNNGLKFGSLRLGESEQYWTGTRVCPLPRTITVRLNTSLPSQYVNYLDGAIARYNAEGLSINFVRVTSGGDIVINPAPAGATYLAAAGFSTTCAPYPQILVNRSYLDTWNLNTCITIVAHEIGHCIGFRHTDQANRACSGCSGTEVPPGTHIPGTPNTPCGDPNSWMMACINNNVNRPFTAFDRVALNWMY